MMMMMKEKEPPQGGGGVEKVQNIILSDRNERDLWNSLKWFYFIKPAPNIQAVKALSSW